MKNEIIKNVFDLWQSPKINNKKTKKENKTNKKRLKQKKKETKYPHNNQIITATYLEYYDVVDW